MSQNFIKSLDPYENNSGKPIKGKYHFDIPHDIEPACYTMNIDYESHDEANPDAYQYDGYIVIGYNSYLRTYVVHVPFDTTATTEEGVTLYEKRNTTFNAICDAFKNSDFTSPIKDLPLQIRFKKGVFKDYYNLDRSVWLTDYNSAYEPVTKPNPHNTDNNGKTTTNFKVSDVYSAEETINDLNTLFFRLKGTRNRGNDNYVPNIIPIACILGTTTINLKQTTSDFTTVTSNDVNFELPSSSINVAATCGHGKQKLGMNILYKFALNDQYLPKVGYEDYYNDNDFYCKVGKLQLQYNAGNEWVTVPASQLSAADANTIVDSEGYITQKQGSEQGGVQVYWTNPLKTNTSKVIQYRWKYTGKPGATFGAWGTAYNMVIDPQYGTPVQFNSRLIMNQNTFTGTPGSPIQICGKLQQKEGGVWVDATEGQGIVTVDLGDGTTQTATVNANGTFCVSVTSEGGDYDITVSYHDPTGLYKDATTTSHLSIESTGTKIIINDSFSADIGNFCLLSGKIVSFYNGTQHDITNGTGKVTGVFTTPDNQEYEEEVNIDPDGTFTLTSHRLVGGTYNVVLTFTDSSLKFAESTKNTKIIAPYNVSIQLSSNSINVLNGDSFSVNGTVILNDGNANVPYYRVSGTEAISNSLNSDTFTINSDGTFTATGVAPSGDSNVTLTYAGNAELKRTTTTLAIHAIKSDVSLKFSKPLIRAYDSGANDSSTYKITLKDDYNQPVKSGTVEIRLQSKYWEFYPKSDVFNKYTLIKSYTVPSTGELNVNAYELINQTFLNKFSKYPYFRYYLIARYVPTETNKYNAVDELDTIRNNETVHDVELEYRVYNPKVEMKIWVKSPSASSFPSTPTHSISLTNLNFSQNHGNLSSEVNGGNIITVPQNANIKIEFGLFDSNNHRLGGIRYAKWVTTDKQIPVYVQANEYPWEYVLNDQNQKQTYLDDVHRTVISYEMEMENGEPKLDANGNPKFKAVENPTPVPRHPCYTGIPIPFETMFFTEEPTGTYEVTSENYNRFNFALPEEANGTSTLFLGFTKYMGYILPGRGEDGVINEFPNLILALQGGLDSQTNYYSSQTLGEYTREYSIYFNIKFKVQ